MNKDENKRWRILSPENPIFNLLIVANTISMCLALPMNL